MLGLLGDELPLLKVGKSCKNSKYLLKKMDTDSRALQGQYGNVLEWKIKTSNTRQHWQRDKNSETLKLCPLNLGAFHSQKILYTFSKNPSFSKKICKNPFVLKKCTLF